MQKAINSHDTNLIYLILLHLETAYSTNKPLIFKFIQPYPEAISLLKQYYTSKRNNIKSEVSSSSNNNNNNNNNKAELINYLLMNKNYYEAGIKLCQQIHISSLLLQNIRSSSSSMLINNINTQILNLYKDANQKFIQGGSTSGSSGNRTSSQESLVMKSYIDDQLELIEYQKVYDNKRCEN